jgi:hypothetical protein
MRLKATPKRPASLKPGYVIRASVSGYPGTDAHSNGKFKLKDELTSRFTGGVQLRSG